MRKYIIESGDTISAIAKANGISQKKLLAANQSISDANAIKVGDQLTIPEKIEDPATQAAMNQSNSGVDSVVQPCPLRAEWLTIKPLRYAVADEDSDISLPKDFTINADMPALKQHKYIVREVTDQSVYLYHPKEHYLLEVTYEAGKAKDSRCVFGTPEADIKSALPLFKQKKDSEVVMWLTHAPLTEARITLLKDNPSLIEKAGQKITFANAAKGKEANIFPLFKGKDIIAELLTKVTEQLSWTAAPLLSGATENSILGDCNNATPDNGYGVCLVDPITITSDLCREFSIAYEMVMTNMATTQHPFQMAKLTHAVINRETKNAHTATELSEDRLRVLFGTFPSPEFTQSLIVSGFSDEKKNRLFEEKRQEHEKGFQQYLSEYKEEVESQRKQHAQERKSELEEHIHVKEMDQFLADHPNAAKKQKKILEDLAEDWVSWLKDDKGSLDLAFTWLDDADETQIPLKEALVAAMINNINVFDKGAELAKKWTDYIADQIEKGSDTDPVQTKGLGAHLMIAMGYLGKGVLVGSPWLNTFSGLVDGERDAVEKYRKSLLESSNYRVTYATEVLLETTTTHMARISVITPRSKQLWGTTFKTMGQRYGYLLDEVETNLGVVAPDIKASYAAMAAASGGQMILAETYTQEESRVLSQKKVTLYDLEQTADEPSKYPRFLAKYMNKAEVYAANSEGIKSAFRNSEKVFTPARQVGFLGLFAAAQLYNTITLAEAMKQVDFAEDRRKIKVDFFAALYAVATTSIALVDKLASKAFAGSTLTVYIAGEGKEMGKGAVALGNKVTKSLQKFRLADSVFRTAELTESYQMKFYDLVGKGATKVVGYAFRAIPAIGAALSSVSSFLQVQKDLKEQNAGATALSALSFVTNIAAMGTFVLAIVYTGPALIPLAIVLSIVALGFDVWHSMIADDVATVLLKRSFWGKSEYKYAKGLTTLDDKIAFFAINSDKAEPEEDVVKVVMFELRAFCNHLYKPIASILKQSKDDKTGFSKFVVQIYLPGFMQWKSDVALSIIGRTGATSVQLATNSRDNTWKTNHLKGGLTMHNNGMGLISLEIDEAMLATQKIKKTGQMSRYNETDKNVHEGAKSMDYHTYQLSLEYKYPAGVPVILNYPNITIDDDKWSMSFWRNETEIEDFYLERAFQ